MGRPDILRSMPVDHRHSAFRYAPFVLTALAFAPRHTTAQSLVLDLGPDTLMCPGMRMSFHAQDGFLTYTWDDGSGNTVRSIRDPMIVYCEALEVLREGEALLNGDFSAGDTDYMTDVGPVFPGPYGDLSSSDTHAVGTSTTALHSAFPNCGDHTSGHGNMLVVNGDTVPGNAWCGQGHVQPYTDYVFSFWHIGMDPSHPAKFTVTINGELQEGSFRSPPTPCQWGLGHLFWTSGADPDVMVCIHNSAVDKPGNDFALDDISLAPYVMHHDTVVVALPEWCPDDGSTCGCQIMIPNAFTPDGDDLNEVWQPRHDCPIKEWRFRVVDNWGHTLFYSEDSQAGWNGTDQASGDALPSGLYRWILETRSDAVDIPRLCTRQGHVMLVR